MAHLPRNRLTTDVDVVLRMETGSVSGLEVTRTLNQLGDTLQAPLKDSSPAHRFVRHHEGMKETIDVMVADHGVSKPKLRLGGREPFQIPAGTQALKRTINCHVLDAEARIVATLSIPSALAA